MTGPVFTRPGYGGAAGITDQHIEDFQLDVDTLFEYNAIFRQLSAQRSVMDRSNTFRFDMMGRPTVMGRTAGQPIESQAVAQDKVNIVVDQQVHIRCPIDEMDMRTARDITEPLARTYGTSFAEVYDMGHIIQLMKSRNYTVPPQFVSNSDPVFTDGTTVVAEYLPGVGLTYAQLEANAVSLVLAHRAAVDTLRKRGVDPMDLVTLVYVDQFSTLLEHPKLINFLYNDGPTGSNGSYGNRRLGMLNGVEVIENRMFPLAASTGNALGPEFDVTSDDSQIKMIVFSKRDALFTVEAMPYTTTFWHSMLLRAHILDGYSMYNVGWHRPGTVVNIQLVAPV